MRRKNPQYDKVETVAREVSVSFKTKSGQKVSAKAVKVTTKRKPKTKKCPECVSPITLKKGCR